MIGVCDGAGDVVANEITKVHLIGYSMGGLHTLFIAELESKAKEKTTPIHFFS